MQVLSYGYKKPEGGDRGTPLFVALQDDIQQLNDHNHTGGNSAPLTAQAVVGVTQDILTGPWSNSGLQPGHYRQLVTLPAGFSFDTVQIGFRLTTGQVILPTVEKVSATQYYVYTIDNTLAFKAIYGG